MSDDVKRQHISTNERIKWDAHIGASGTAHHKLGNGTVAGFSTNDYTNVEKTTLQTLNSNVGGVRLTISTTPPSNPVVDKEVWIDRGEKLLKIYTSTGWDAIGSVFL